MAKKIILTICSSLVGALLIATIILACTSYTAYGIVNDKAYSIEVYKNGYETSTKYVYDNEDEVYTNVISKLKDSLKENNLSALFQNVRSFKTRVENVEKKISEAVDANDGSYYVAFYYSTPQILVIDGKEYVNENSTTKETVKYTQLWMEIKNSSSFTSYTAYLVDASLSVETSYFQVVMIGEQAPVYDYLASLK